VHPREIGFVVIGRNEGERLRRCLGSVPVQASGVVYVDSASTDGSRETACSLGADVVALESDRPFTAARARNAGFRRLRRMAPGAAYVQFIDGDAELCAGWAAAARRFLDAHPEVAVVAGRRRERYPERSVYNLLCDIEWDRPAGETSECGGDAMIRTAALEAVGGFRETLIAGEEPDLCARLRAAGWSVWRLPGDMTLHDANMTRFAQWWRRAYRSGHAFAEGAYLHRREPVRHWAKESRRAWIWGLGLPVLGAICLAAAGPTGGLVFALYPLQVARLALRGARSARQNWWHAVFLVLGKFPEALGQGRFVMGRWLGKRTALIEYK
jgi:GT2 family glycosyltransferase